MSVNVIWMDGEELCFICDDAEIIDNMIIIYFSSGRCEYIPIVNIRQVSTNVKINERRTDGSV
jgi:hypothetical protein